jgi:hypothetical protein
MYYIYTWKCHKETPCVAILNKQKWAEQVMSGELVPVGRGEDVGKGCRRVNMVQILCAHVCKWKNETC